ncbi:hypothetical protein CO670_07810 [Rhizobium sp. J15]|uniref:hypothetical protein n=1 Tax=Rhizobium sp. J15 TaxID=2035450 RepID=UPI000BEAE880|nr:hypothetical protein [Rhizobium sp. J15]PDT17627.1 hypothetical protein CO670_07810 [Rhizobium sp. J15]
MAFQKRRSEVLILEFSGVREKGRPIMGMQGRPASGPGPLMGAIASIAKLRDAGMLPWRAAIYADHYAAECVLVGGARRAARMATKHWKDKTIFGFIELKRGGFLWSSNNSVAIDAEFRERVTKVVKLIGSKDVAGSVGYATILYAAGKIDKWDLHAYKVLCELAKAAYHDKTGEPGLINVDKLTHKNHGIEAYVDGLYAQGSKYAPDEDARRLMTEIAEQVINLSYQMIVNPCGDKTILVSELS